MPALLPEKSTTVVLIVEDDALLRMLAVETVEEAGFKAIEAADADEAITLLESRSDIVLLLTDIDMPGSMNGLKLAQTARNRWPSIEILIVSGQMRPQPSQLPSHSRFLAKPYPTAALIEGLHALAALSRNSERELGSIH